MRETRSSDWLSHPQISVGALLLVVLTHVEEGQYRLSHFKVLQNWKDESLRVWKGAHLSREWKKLHLRKQRQGV